MRPAFLGPDVLAALRRVLDRESGELAEVMPAQTGRRTVATEIRRAWEVQIPEALHERVLEAIDDAMPELEDYVGVGLRPCDGVAALRYPTGAFYRPHRDGSTDPAHPAFGRGASVVIFLNGDDRSRRPEYRGGRLRLVGPMDAPFDEPLEPIADPGTLVVFPPDWLHEVTPVLDGERRTIVTWLMRVDRPGR